MKFLILKTTNPYLNLAIEEYMFSETDDDVFMLWRNEPTIVIGKNQNGYAEINMPYVKENNIHIARRITGGGAVYHDLGNVNYTFITGRNKTGIDFEYFTAPIIEALKKLGISAILSGRNDLLVGDKKFSGNAQHTKGTRVLHHGTLLFDTDLDVLSLALKVDEEKIKAKAIKSTRSRVVNIKSILSYDMTAEDFINVISDFVIKKYSPEITEAPDNEKTAALAKRNASDEWIFPEKDFVARYDVIKKKKYPFGLVEIHLAMSNETVKELKIFGDFFGIGDISELEARLVNAGLSDIKYRLSEVDVGEYIFGMTNNDLCDQILS